MSVTTVAGIHEVVINVGGVPLSLHTNDPAFSELLRNRYGDFLGEAPGEITFDVELVDPIPVTDDAETLVTLRGADWVLERGDFYAEWNAERRLGRIRQSANPYSIDSVLRIVYTLILARQGGFLVHAASATRDNKAFLFSGLSGAGKTTISRLTPPNAKLLTDEISFVRRIGSEYRAFGTPFAGDFGKPGENVSAPVATLYFLDKAETNSVAPVPPAEAVRRLMRNILFFTHDKESVNLVFQSACAFVAAVPTRRLGFYPDERVWDVIE